MLKSVFAALMIVVMIPLCVQADKISDILAEADSWIISDTSKMMTFIDSCNQVTDENLRSSKHWNDVSEKLSFLLGIDYVGSAQIDNTGRVYFMMRLTGEIGHLFYVDKPMGWPIQLSPNNWLAEGYTIWSYDVHPSGDYVLVSAMKYGNERHDIWKFNRDGSFVPLLVNSQIRYSNIVYKNKDEFFLGIDDQENQYFCKYTISTGALDTLYQDSEWAGIYDYEDGTLLCGRYFSFSENQLFTLDENSLKAKDLTERGNFDTAYLTKDGRVVSTTNVKSKTDEFMKLVVFDLNKPKKMKVVYDPKMENAGYEFIKSKNIVIMTLNKDGYSELVGLDLDGNKVDVPSIPVGVLSGGGPYDDNGSTNEVGDFVYGFSSPNLQPTIFHFKIGENKIIPVATVSTFGFDFSNVKVEVVRYPSLDGEMIPALLYAPGDLVKNGKNPAIVQYHGGPAQQWRPYFQRNLAFALSQGLVVMRPNVRGSSGYGPAWEEADNQEGRFASLGDAEAALDWLVDEGYSNYNQIGIEGASYGGYTVNYLAANAPEKFACVISEVGPSDHDYGQSHGDVGGRNIWENEFAATGSDLSHKLSPVFKADKVKRPMIIKAGHNDPRVFAGDPRRFAYLLGMLGAEVFYLEDVETGHGATTKEKLITDLTRNYVFMMEHIVK